MLKSLALLCLCLPLAVAQQQQTSPAASAAPVAPEPLTTGPDIEARLINQPLVFRLRPDETHLRFTADGTLRSRGLPVPFTMSGFSFHSLELKKDRLILRGTLVVLEFQDDQPKRVELPQEVTAEVDAPPTGNYRPALDQIFVTDLADLIPVLPPFWQPFAQRHFAHTPPAPPSPPPSPGDKTVNVLPKLIHRVDPPLTLLARLLKFSGKSTLTLQIDPDGHPSHIAIVHPAGLQLDDLAIASVQQYRFKPAMSNGTPIPMQVNLDIAFQTF